MSRRAHAHQHHQEGSAQQLSDKAIFRTLGAEPYRAEILARASGSLEAGACTHGQFDELVNMELTGLSLTTMPIPSGVREAMAAEFKALMARYSGLQHGDSLELDFNIE